MDTALPRKVFDCCAMIGRWHREALKFASADQLLGEMRQAGIDRALVFHSIALLHDFRAGNERLDLELRGRAELTPCYAVIPFTTGEMPGPEAWDARLAQGDLAWRLFPATHGFMMRAPRPGDLFAYAEDRRIPLFVDIDEIDFGEVWTLLRDHPGLRLILGNAGTSSLFGIYREFRRIYEFLESFEHVALEMSFLIGFRGMEDICRRFGPGRILFGTRMPFLEPGSALTRLQYAEIEPEAKDRIAAGNLERLLAEARR